MASYKLLIFSQQDKEEIQAQETNHNRQRAVLLLLQRVSCKKIKWFPLFIEALNNNGYGYIVEQIDPKLAKAGKCWLK